MSDHADQESEVVNEVAVENRDDGFPSLVQRAMNKGLN